MDVYRKLLIFLLVPLCVSAQTGTINVDQNHTGHKIYGLPTPAASDEAATKGYADSVGGGGGGGSGTVTSITATAPIVVTPSPITTTGVISISGTSYGLGFLPLADASAARGYIGALGSSSIDNTAYGSSWVGFTTIAPSKKAVYDEIHSFTTAHDGFVNVLDQTTGITNTNGIGIVQAPKLIGTDIQAYDADLTSLSAATGTNTIYYRSAADTWSPVTIGGNMTFSSGTLNAVSGGSGTVTTTGSPATGNLTKFSGATSITNGDLSGNVTTSGTLATTIANSAVTYAKVQNVSANSVLLGSSATGSGAPPSEIALGTNLSMSGSTLNAASGGSVSITATSPIVVTPTPLTGTGVVSLNKTVDLAMTALQTITLTDAGTTTFPDILTVDHESSGTPAVGFGSAILFQGKDNNNATQPIGRIRSTWTNATHLSHASAFAFEVTNNGSLPAVQMILWGQAGSGGSLSVGNTTDPAAGGLIIANSGYWVGTAASTTGKILQSDGAKFTASTPTWPAAAGAVGYTIRSDATNFASYPAQLINSSVTSQSPSTSDVYLAGSNIVVTAGDMKAKGQYKCVFDMTKSAGTGAIVITLRVGVNGTTADAAIQTYTFGAGTSVSDFGLFEVIATWRTVGSGTSAVMQGMCRGTHQLATTGLFNNAAGWMVLGSPSPSAGFASNAATNIGISFNGSTAFAGTTQVVQAQLQQ